MQVSVGNQTKRSRLASLTSSKAEWNQDFAFVVALPLRTRPLKLELHQSSGRRRKGRVMAQAFIPLADLFPEGTTESGSLLAWQQPGFDSKQHFSFMEEGFIAIHDCTGPCPHSPPLP